MNNTNNLEINKLFELIKEYKWNDIKKILDNDKDNSIDINVRDNNNNYLLTYAVLYNNIDILKYLIKKGARIDIIDNEDKPIAYLTIKYNYINILKELLENNKISIGISLINIRDKNQNILLHYAISYKNYEAIKLLLEYGSNVNITNKDGHNALHLAIYSRSIEICKLILNYNIDINAKSEIGETPLHIACNLQEIEIVKLLLTKKNININSQDYDNEFTPLHYSMNLNNIEQIKLLLNNNAEINIQDIYGNTPIHYCIIEDNYQSFSVLTSEKYKSKLQLNLWNIDSKIPLHLVFDIAELDKKKYIDELIEKSNINIQDSNGNTCLHHLCKQNLWKDYKHFLINKKLDITLLDKNNKRPCDYIKESSLNEFIDMVTESYLFRLRFNISGTQWSTEWENICKKEFFPNKKEANKKVISHLEEITHTKKETNKDLCRTIVTNKIKAIINDKPLSTDNNNKCYEKSFPIKNSYFCLKLSSQDQNVGVCTFTGTTLDILIGLIYLLRKHTSTCSTLSEKFIENKDLCKFYSSIGVSIGSKCEFLNFEIIWVHNKLYLTEKFTENFNKCSNNKNKRFVIIPVGIEMRQGSHANYLIYDKKLKELERFEPHGGTTPIGFNYNPNLFDNILENKLKTIDETIKYIKPQDYLPKIGFQTFDSLDSKRRKIGDPKGFCALWGIWYVDMRVTYADMERKKLIKNMIKHIRAQNMSFKNLIRNYAKNIIDIRDNILLKSNVDINDWLNEQVTDEQINQIVTEIQKNILSVI